MGSRIKYFFFLILFFISSITHADLLLYDGCNDGTQLNTGSTATAQYWIVRDCGDGEIVYSTDQAYSGTGSYKFTLDRCGTAINSRAELDLLTTSIVDGGRFQFETEYWLGFAVYYPSDFDFPDNWRTLWQFHVAKDGAGTCGSETYPLGEYSMGATTQPFSGWLDGTAGSGTDDMNLYEVVSGESSLCATTTGVPAGNVIETYSVNNYQSATITRGSWHTVVMQFKFDHDSNNGFVRAWLDDVEWLEIENDIIGHYDIALHYLKLGMYSGDYDEVIGPFYIDEIRIGDADSTYNDVVPSGTTYITLSDGQIDGSASGVSLPAGTTTATMTVTSSANATVKFSTTQGTAYADMTGTFDTTGSTSHSESLSGLSAGVHTYYCLSEAGADEYAITFSIGSEVNLLTAARCTVTSDNLAATHPIANSFDGCVEQTPECTTGNESIAQAWVECELGVNYNLSTLKIFGDADGNWTSDTWTFKYKTDSGDEWTTDFTGQDCLANDWTTHDVTDLDDVGYVRIEVNSTDSSGIQWRELFLTGTVTPTPPSNSGLRAIAGRPGSTSALKAGRP